jgi:S1-C subfamily serine protease
MMISMNNLWLGITLIFFLSGSSTKSIASENLYSKVLPGCVEILVGGRLDGSGVILDKNGSVLTALHVIRKKQKTYECLSRELGRLPLKLVATYRGCDLALLSLPKRKQAYPTLSLANKIPEEGTKVFLIGSPIFRHQLLLTGFIARRTPTFSWYDQAFTETFPITGMAAPGTSGGPWMNDKGEVFGIQVAGVTTDLGHQGVNSVVGIKSIKKLLAAKKDIVVPTIGSAVEELWGQSPRLLEKLPTEIKGLLFRQVTSKGVCAKAGIKNEDIMLSANGKTYERIEPFIKYVRSLKIDSEVNLKVCDAKGENKKQVKITLRPLN